MTFPLVVSERQMQQVGGDLVYDQMKVCMRACACVRACVCVRVCVCVCVLVRSLACARAHV